MILSYLNLPAFIYDATITRPLTKYTYMHLYEKIHPNIHKIKSILDVGTGTGVALSSIINNIPRETQITGIDIDKHYVQAAQKKFKDRSNVEIREQNFYELEHSNEKYDLIIFSSSFMLMPFREKALQIAKTLMNENGKIVFLMTLYEKKDKFKVIEKVKPYIKYYTTIDFGTITYETDFLQLLGECGLAVKKQERIYHKMNPLLKIFREFYVETDVSSLLSAK